MRHHWLGMGAAGLIGAALALAGSFLVTKIYRAEVLLSPVSTEGQSGLGSLIGRAGAFAGMAGIELGEEGKATAETMAILKSRAFLEHFIADRNLLPTLFQRRPLEKHRQQATADAAGRL